MAKFDKETGERLDPEPDQYAAQKAHDQAKGTKNGIPQDSGQAPQKPKAGK